MSNSASFWRALETIPFLSAVEAEWRGIVGNDHPALKPFLQVRQEFATCYPCPDPGGDGCPRRIIVHGPDDIAAVCHSESGHCERLQLKRDDIIVYALDLRALGAFLARAFGFEGATLPAAEGGLARTVYLGAHVPGTGHRFPAYLTHQPRADAYLQVIERLTARHGSAVILFAPTTNCITPACSAALRVHRSTVVGLSDITAIRDGSIVFERAPRDILGAFEAAHGVEAEGTDRGKKPRQPTRTFHMPPGATWEDVELVMTDLSLRVAAKGRHETMSFQEAGFEEGRRRNVPDRLWALLRVFALRGGVVPFNDPALSQELRTSLKQNMTSLRTRLRDLLQLDDDPFQDARKSRQYEARFKISTADGLRFPTPAGATWDRVSIEESASGRIVVSVEATENFSTFDRDSDDPEAGGGWESAERQGVIRRDYDLATLGLADPSTTTTATGTALLDVLRHDGKVRREADDVAMLDLCGFLTELLQIPSPPFQYAEATTTWLAVFDASSAAAQPSR